jgi:cytochrome c
MLRLAIAALALGLVAQPALAADGATVYNQRCKMCHQDKSTPMAPTLKGVSGAKVATRPGYNYSNALKKKGGTWTDANLNAWLAAPTKYAPGTKMMIGMPNAADRAAVVAHLKTLK